MVATELRCVVFGLGGYILLDRGRLSPPDRPPAPPPEPVAEDGPRSPPRRGPSPFSGTSKHCVSVSFLSVRALPLGTQGLDDVVAWSHFVILHPRTPAAPVGDHPRLVLLRWYRRCGQRLGPWRPFALQSIPTVGDTARCSQVVSVRPNSSYTLTAWVKGPNMYLGADGGSSIWSTRRPPRPGAGRPRGAMTRTARLVRCPCRHRWTPWW